MARKEGRNFVRLGIVAARGVMLRFFFLVGDGGGGEYFYCLNFSFFLSFGSNWILQWKS